MNIELGHDNKAFSDIPELVNAKEQNVTGPQIEQSSNTKENNDDHEQERAVWGNQVEFLMSCIAASVGLGNVWRFPFVAYKNGGGAFLIPYIIVLLVIGKPIFYMECSLGQFSSRNSVRIWALSPAMKGTGYAQCLVSGYIVSYYMSIIALCLYYFAMSFQAQLPWAVCSPDWTDVTCLPSAPDANHGPVVNATSSAELYFIREVLQRKDGIEDGIGSPVWYLTLCLLASWIVIFIIINRGVKSSGKAAYFLAIFPYVVLITLLISASLMDGAVDGILFFITPQWGKLLDLNVWYAAITQVFFSLGVSAGMHIMYSSYNKFDQNIYRDSLIVTTLDTCTSVLSGITIFGILGNLAYELGQNIEDVIRSGGTGLAFISYPDAIAKSFQPQLLSVLFFLMMSVLGIGSAVAYLSTINTVLMDAFPKVRTIIISSLCCTSGFLISLIYVTPGGQYILEIVDHFGGTFLALFCAITEVVGIMWIYGVENVCLDIEFMLGIKTSPYWRICWGILIPIITIVVFIYTLVSSERLRYGDDYIYPTAGYVSGYLMLFIGIAFIPIFITYYLWKNKTDTCTETIKKTFHAEPTWGPSMLESKIKWDIFKNEAKLNRHQKKISKARHYWYIITGGYRKK